MKTLIFISIFSTCIFYSCQKEDVINSNNKEIVDSTANIVQPSPENNYSILYYNFLDKPVDSIKNYLNGKWQLHYVTRSGAISCSKAYLITVQYFVDFNFANVDSIKFYNDSHYIADNSVDFSPEMNIFTNDSSFAIKFYLPDSHKLTWIPGYIMNDTLYISENDHWRCNNGMALTKVKVQ